MSVPHALQGAGKTDNGAIGAGIVALGTTLLILFMYLEFRLTSEPEHSLRQSRR